MTVFATATMEQIEATFCAETERWDYGPGTELYDDVRTEAIRIHSLKIMGVEIPDLRVLPPELINEIHAHAEDLEFQNDW